MSAKLLQVKSHVRRSPSRKCGLDNKIHTKLAEEVCERAMVEAAEEIGRWAEEPSFHPVGWNP